MSETYNNSEIYVDLVPAAEVNVEITPSLEIQVEIVATGPQGPPGDSADLSADSIIETDEKQFISLADKLKLAGFIHDQIATSSTWVVNHTLDKFPSVSVVDTGGNLVMGDVEYISTSQLKIYFSYEFSGKAYLN